MPRALVIARSLTGRLSRQIETVMDPGRLSIVRQNIDLLVVFDVLMVERSASRTAARLSLGQPAISHNLNQLRKLFKDPLLTRTSSGLEPTRRARDLHAKLEPLLKEIYAVFNHDHGFHQATSVREFRMMCLDIWQPQYIPRLTSVASVLAPHVTFYTMPFELGSIVDAIDREEVDVAIANDLPEPIPRIQKIRMFKAGYSCWYNPAFGPAPDTLEEYIRRPHIAVSYRDLPSPVSAALKKFGIKRKIHATVNDYYTAAAFAAKTDAIVTGPIVASDHNYMLLGLVVCPVPYEIDGPYINLYWHERRNADPASKWLRETILHVNGMM